MKLRSSIASRPVFWFILLGLLVASIPVSVIFTYHVMSGRIEHSIQIGCDFLRQQVLIETRIISGFSLPVDTSVLNIARMLSSSRNETHLPLSKLEKMVAPRLFQAYLTLPYISEISYMGSDGLFLSYYKEKNGTRVIYSNTSFVESNPPNVSTMYNWYTQPVDSNTGIPYGETTVSKSTFFVNSSWYQEAKNSSDGYYFVGSGWGKSNESLFLSMVAINGGVVSLGSSVKGFAEAISRVDLLKGTFLLATKDGILLAHSGTLNAHIKINNDDISLEFKKSDGDLTSKSVNFSCQPRSDTLRVHDVDIYGVKYRLYCEPLEIARVQSVSVLVFPENGILTEIQKNNHLSLILLVVSLISMVFVLFFFVFSTFKSFLREMYLQATLMKQKEATQQAERKSMSKSLAFAQASHDIRGSLTAIISFIDFCRDGGSTIDNNLLDIKTSSLELIGLLNSVLDTSKIEAGKMQLEEKDFDLSQITEEVVNMFYLVGMKKGIDVLLDPCDGSVLKSSLVRGDPGKLKQILINLVSNAIKFTSEGHVTVRAWVKKPTVESSILASKSNSIWNSISRLFYRSNEESYSNALHTNQQDRNTVEFVFQVDDTGVGIPKDQRKSVFENFVQVRDKAFEQGGTGLGLGIVQSLVRLMGGEIKIVEKERGERGTCFHFNIFLSICKTGSPYNAARINTCQVLDRLFPNEPNQSLGQQIWNQSARVEGSHVMLLIQGDERRKVLQNFMQSFLGLKVSALTESKQLLETLETESKQLLETLERSKNRLHFSHHHSSSGKSDIGYSADHLSNSTSHHSNAGVEYQPPFQKRMGSRKIVSRNTMGFVLIVIDDSLNYFHDVCTMVDSFRRELGDSRCKVVALVSSDYTTKMQASYHPVRKPLHGSRLYDVLSLLPEFRGNYIEGKKLPNFINEFAQASIEQNKTDFTDSGNSGTLQSLSLGKIQWSVGTSSSPSSYKPLNGNKILAVEDQKPLDGKKVLVVEDLQILRTFALKVFSSLGAITEFCVDGEAAVKQICKAFQEIDQRIQGPSKFLPYDYIFMDCEMPKMNGYEATRQIRKEERFYDVHIPIIALSAHEGNGAEAKSIEAGMDMHITKPLNQEKLLDVIRIIDGNSHRTRGQMEMEVE